MKDYVCFFVVHTFVVKTHLGSTHMSLNSFTLNAELDYAIVDRWQTESCVFTENINRITTYWEVRLVELNIVLTL